MLKKILYFILALAVLAGIGVGIVLWNINPILESFRPELTRIASTSIGQPVSLGELQLKFFPRLAVNIAELGLKTADGKPNPGAQLEGVSVKADLQALLKRELNVEEIEVERLNLSVTKNAQGQMLVGGVEIPKKPESDSGADESTTSSDNADTKPNIAINIKNTFLRSGRIQWTDESLPKPETLVIDDLFVAVKGASPENLEQVLLQASLLGTAKKNFQIELKSVQLASLGPIPGTGELSFDWSSIDFEKISSLLAAYQVSPADVKLGSDGKFQLHVAVASEGATIKSTLDLSGASVIFGDSIKKETGTPLVINVEGKGNLAEVDFEKIDLQIGSSKLSLPTSYAMMQGLAKIAVRSEGIQLTELSTLLPNLAALKLQGSIVPNIAAEILPDPSAQGALSQIQNLSGNVEFRQVGVVAGTQEIKNITGKVELKKDEILFKPFALSILGQNVDLGAKITSFEQPKLQAAARGVFGGTVTAEAAQLPAEQVRTSIRVEKLNVSDALKIFAPDAKVSLSGILERLNVDLSGASNSFAETVTGSVNGHMGKGAIEGVNIIEQALGKLTSIPGLSASVLQLVPEKLRSILQVNATSFDKLTLAARLRGKNIDIDQIELLHSQYVISGKGIIEASGDLKINGTLKLTPEVAQGMIAREAKIKLLLDPIGNISFPVLIKRENGIFLVLPDASELGKLAVQNTAKEAAGRVLDKVAPGLGQGLGGALDSLFK